MKEESLNQSHSNEEAEERSEIKKEREEDISSCSFAHRWLMDNMRVAGIKKPPYYRWQKVSSEYIDLIRESIDGFS